MALWSRFGFASKTARAGGDISIWAVPTLGGQPRPYLEGVAEFDWSHDGSRLAYHTPGPGDPLFVSDGSQRAEDRPIFTAPAGLHCSFSVVVARHGIHLFRPRFAAGQIGHLAHPSSRREPVNGSRRTMGA